MDWTAVVEWLVPSSAGALLGVAGTFIGIGQTRKYQDRADLHAEWDRIGLSGGIEVIDSGWPGAPLLVPHMNVRIRNVGRATAFLIDLQTTSANIGHTQETDDGVRPYQSRLSLSPEEGDWSVNVPLYKTFHSFDHPPQVLDAKLMRPTLTIRWRKPHGKGMVKRVVTLDGEWLRLYVDIVGLPDSEHDQGQH